jgi:hypothetical protein
VLACEVDSVGQTVDWPSKNAHGGMKASSAMGQLKGKLSGEVPGHVGGYGK